MTASAFILLMIFVLIQSIYGVGLLVFGVPVLLIYGLDYSAIVGLLLPSSIFISILQLFKNRNIKSSEIKLLPLAAFGIIIGLGLSMLAVTTNMIPIIVGFSMLFITLLRTNASIRQNIAVFLIKNRPIFHLLNAILHGFSNLGGALLTFYSASVYKEKTDALHCTSLFYLVYAVSQMAILIFIERGDIFRAGLLCLPFTAFLYLLIGQKTFRLISQRKFDNLATVFFFFAGLMFLSRTAIF